MRSRPFVNPGFAAAVAQREAQRAARMTALEAKVVEQSAQIRSLRAQLAASVNARRKPIAEAAE
jgi:hypothetical protein